jgi:hypothetical protein
LRKQLKRVGWKPSKTYIYIHMAKDKKRILITLHCVKCGKNLEHAELVHVYPRNGAVKCTYECTGDFDGRKN